MEKGSQEKVLRTYEAALALPEEERDAFIDAELDGDAELREIVEALIRSKSGKKRKKRSGRVTPTPAVDQNSDTQSFSALYGDSLPDHYRFIERIGKGGMGEVVLAEDVRLNRKVAVKFLSKDLTSDPERLKRFRYEAQAASALSHPNIVTIHDIGEGSGSHFIVCEYVSGETLSRRIARGRLPLEEAVKIASEICSALAAAHGSGIIHRDIKPDNVILRKDGGLKVLDFGLAKPAAAPEQEIDNEANTYQKVSTIPGMVLGTPQYMSPEQARGKVVDGRTDIFSLGVILYEMVTGRPPFTGETTVDIILSITNDEPPRIERELIDPPEGLVRVIRKALMKDRRDRYDSAEAMLDDLRMLRSELDTAGDGMAPTGIMNPKTTARNTISSIFGKQLVWEVPVFVLVTVAIAFAIYYYALPTGAGEPAAVSFRPLAIAKWPAGPGDLIFAASFSPDGKSVAFGAAADSTHTRIWFQPTAGGDRVKVTKEDFYSQYPVWSPDGGEIAFFSNRTDEPGIWKVRYTGGTPVKIVGGIEPAAALKYWAKSGKIYFKSGPNLYSVSAEGGTPTAVTNFEKTESTPLVLEISRDESKIAYSVLDGDVWNLKVAPVSGGEPAVIASSPDPIYQAAWGPKGNFVYFSASDDGVYQVFRAALESGELVRISNDLQDLQVEDVSMDGKRVLYSHMEERVDLWLANTESGEENPVTADLELAFWADFSPDGRSMVYQSVEKSGSAWEGNITIQSRADRRGILIAEKGFSPTFSHDGAAVAYFTSKNGKREIRKVGVKGGDAVKLADGELRTPDYMQSPYLKVGSNHISWSLSDDLIALSRRENGVSDIWAVPTGGGAGRRLTGNQNEKDVYCCTFWTSSDTRIVFYSGARKGSFSDRGAKAIWVASTGAKDQKILFHTDERLVLLGPDGSGKAAVFITAPSDTGEPAVPEKIRVAKVNLDTAQVTELGEITGAFFYNVQISPDGRSLAYVARNYLATSVELRDLESGVERTLLTEKDPRVMMTSLEWSPDGKQIVFGRQMRSNFLSMFVE